MVGWVVDAYDGRELEDRELEREWDGREEFESGREGRRGAGGGGCRPFAR